MRCCRATRKSSAPPLCFAQPTQTCSSWTGKATSYAELTQEILKDFQGKKVQKKLELLNSMPILHSMPLDVLKTLMFKSLEGSLKYGQILFDIGSRPAKLSLIVSGAVTLYEPEQKDSSEEPGCSSTPKLVAVSQRIDRQSVGEEVFLSRKPAGHRAVCSVDGTSILTLDHEELRRFLGTKERLRFEANCLKIAQNHHFLAARILSIKATVARKLAKEKEAVRSGKRQDSKIAFPVHTPANRLSIEEQKKQLTSECNDLIQKFAESMSPSRAGPRVLGAQKKHKKTLSIELFHTSHRVGSARNRSQDQTADPFEGIKLITMNTLNRLARTDLQKNGERRPSLDFRVKNTPMVTVEATPNPKPFLSRSHRNSAPECRSAFEGIQPDPAGFPRHEPSLSLQKPAWTRSPSHAKKEREDSLATALSHKSLQRLQFAQGHQPTPTSQNLGGFFHRRAFSGQSQQAGRKKHPSLRFDA